MQRSSYGPPICLHIRCLIAGFVKRQCRDRHSTLVSLQTEYLNPSIKLCRCLCKTRLFPMSRPGNEFLEPLQIQPSGYQFVAHDEAGSS